MIYYQIYDFEIYDFKIYELRYTIFDIRYLKLNIELILTYLVNIKGLPKFVLQNIIIS